MRRHGVNSLFFTAAGALSLGVPCIAFAQTEDAAGDGLSDIVVTAQKREQSLQDVPISVAVLGQEDLRANRVTNLEELGAIAPGLSVRKTPGGLGAPQMVIRGVVSNGSLAGSDKAVSLNLDGVYIGSNYGLTTDMLDLTRVEVLRGPQGTLFGRNSTGGALSFVTADPTGELGIRQEVTIGNYNQLKSVTHLELPQLGAFSAYASYMHNERDGDIRNRQPGIVFDRSSAAGFGRDVSAKTLGAFDSDSIRAAVKFAPDGPFSLVYKFDWTKARTTPEGSALVYYDPAVAAGFGLTNLNAAVAASTIQLAGVHRPDVVNNAFAVTGRMKSQGHTLTANLELSDTLSVKSISAFRKGSAFGTIDSSGFGQLFYPGNSSPVYVQVSQNFSRQRQWSQELQFNYQSSFATITAGALFFKEKAQTGAPDGLASGAILFGVPLPGNVLPAGRDVTYLKARSMAAFTQAEFHLTSQLDLVGGVRYTEDKKNGTYYKQNPGPLSVSPFSYKDSRATWLAGVNYQLTDDILLYAKYSTGYISGGSIAGVEFDPETAKSWEAGVKSELLDNHLRLNLTGFYAKYTGLQQIVPGRLANRADLSNVLINFGSAKAKGFEAEASFVPVHGMTLAGAVSYTDFEFTRFAPAWESTIISQGGTAATFPTWLRPSTTANFSANYESDSQPGFLDARLVIRFDTNYRSKVVTPGIFNPNLPPQFAHILKTGGNWISNARVGLKDISLRSGKLELAVWARNLFNNDGTVWGGYARFASYTTYEPARTFGLDAIVEF